MGSWTDRDEWRWAGEETWRDNEPRHFRATNERGIGERMREGLHEVGERVKDAFDPDRDGHLGRSEPRHYGSESRSYGGEPRHYGNESRYYGSSYDREPRYERGIGERMREGLRDMGDRVRGAFDPDRDGRWGTSDPRYGHGPGYDRDRSFGQSQWSPTGYDSSRYDYGQRSDYQGSLRTQPPEHSRWGSGLQYPVARDPAFEWGREDYGRGRDLRIPQSGSMLGQSSERWPSGILEDERSRYQAAQGVDRLGRRDPSRPRAPKGYRRPDTTILDEVCLVLGHDVDVDASEIEVEVLNGEVTLKGTVETRDQKRWAESLAEGIRGVTDVHNQLRVRTSLVDRAIDKVKDAFGVDRTHDRRPA